jgi:hypothetical protein
MVTRLVVALALNTYTYPIAGPLNTNPPGLSPGLPSASYACEVEMLSRRVKVQQEREEEAE